MKATIAICTRDRATLLEQTLRNMTDIDQPVDREWEVLVIDNGSSDGTSDVATSFAPSLPIRVVPEPEAGLSNARNRAVVEARGEYILWTDDDVLVAPDWLLQYLSAFEHSPDAAFFGGPIRPWFDGDAPRWITSAWPHIQTAFAARDLGSEPFDLDARRLPFGANYVVRADWQRQHRYSPRLGRRPGDQWIGGEEVDALRRILRAGGCGRWVPGASVRHWIPHERQTYEYVRKYYMGVGRTDHVADGSPGRLRLVGVPLWLWRSWLQAEMRLAVQRTVSRPETWGRTLVDAAVLSGRIAAASRTRVAG